jgi:hypothetical protein
MTLNVEVVVPNLVLIEVVIVSDRSRLERLTVLEELNAKEVGVDALTI